LIKNESINLIILQFYTNLRGGKIYTLSNVFNSVYVFFNKKWFFDRLQNELLISPLLKIGYSTTYKLVDKGLIELFGPSGLGKSALKLSKQVSLLQSGKVNQYAFLIFILLIVFISITLIFSLFGSYVNSEFVFIIVLCMFFNAIFKKQ
jgi:NADH-ubiquinone oxidoreductase chain 5